MRSDPANARISAPARAVCALSKLTVLVVEDEALIALHLADLLEEAGAATLVATSIEDAFQKWAAHRDAVDVALLDVNLNGEAVFPLATTLQGQGVPLVFHSGHAKLLSDLPAQYPNAVWLSKPAQLELILDALRRQLGR